MTDAPATRPMRRSTAIALVLFATVVLFVLIEGAASVLLSGYQLTIRQDAFAEVAHTEYDSLLGWINLPDFRIDDMYGPGVFFQTNSQRFRNAGDFPARVAPGTLRIICSGDSFTLGYGVDNDHAWCELLARKDPAWESINMGQGGYGVDQAYLWYMRDGVAFDHQVQIFSIITPDFQRMTQYTFLGYGRPVLKVQDGELVTTNVPVPKRQSAVRRYDALQRAIQRLRIVELGGKVLERVGWTPQRSAPALTESEARDVTLAMIENLQQVNRSKGSELVVVYLPRSTDKDQRDSDPWRGLLHEESRRSGLIFIDLVDLFRELPLDVGQSLFLSPYHASHYSVAGNQWVADMLHEQLVRDGVLPADSPVH